MFELLNVFLWIPKYISWKCKIFLFNLRPKLIDGAVRCSRNKTHWQVKPCTSKPCCFSISTTNCNKIQTYQTYNGKTKSMQFIRLFSHAGAFPYPEWLLWKWYPSPSPVLLNIIWYWMILNYEWECLMISVKFTSGFR